MANPRSVELFGNLPKDIQMILGRPMDLTIWESIKNSPGVMSFFENYRLEDELSRVTRGNPAVDTHILEEIPEGPEYKIDTSSHEEFPDLEQGMLYRQLSTLHKFGNLDQPDMKLADVPRIYSQSNFESLELPSLNLNTFEMEKVEAENSDENMMRNVPNTPRKSCNLYGIDKANILHDKRVRFNVSKVLTDSNSLEDLYPNNMYFGYQIAT